MAHIATNDKLVESRSKIGRYATTAALIVIIGPLVFSLPQLFSGTGELPTDQLLLMYGALFLGLILSNIGGYYLNRWGFKQYEKVGAALKGLDKRYRLYNYLLPSPNVLLTPSGVVVLLVKNIEGQVTANAAGWKLNAGLLRLLRWFSSEPLGNPTKDLEAEVAKVRGFIQGELGADFKAPVDGLIVFTNPKVEVQIENTDTPVVVLKDDVDGLKNALRRDKKAAQLSKSDYDKLYALFEQEAEQSREQAERGVTVLGRRIF